MSVTLQEDSKVIILLSGGLDSCVLLSRIWHMTQNIIAVHFLYGSKHQGQETNAARGIAGYYGIELIEIDLQGVGCHLKSALLSKSETPLPVGKYSEKNIRDTVVPFRNGIMLSIIAGIAISRKYKLLALAAHADDNATYPDCRPEFMVAMKKAINAGVYSEEEIGFLTPFTMKSKGDIVRIGVVHGAPLSLTYSCYSGGKVHCGECSTCIARREAFVEACIPDITVYSNEPK